MRVPVVQLGHDRLEGIKHVKVGAWIKVGGGECRCRVQHEQLTDSAGFARGEYFLQPICYVDHFPFFAGSDSDTLHTPAFFSPNSQARAQSSRTIRSQSTRKGEKASSCGRFPGPF